MASCRQNIGVICLFVVYLCVVVNGKSVNNVRAKRTADSESSCENVKPFFAMKNITVIPDGPKGKICNGHCCDEKAEAALRRQGQKDFTALLRHNSRSLQGLLSSTSTSLQSHISQLARQSENKTLLLFGNVYQRLSVYAKGPIEAFYSDIRQIMLINDTAGQMSGSPPPGLDIQASTDTFFTDLFPLVYLHAPSNTESVKDFSMEYKSCLKASTKSIVPFGDIPKQISQSLAKSLEATQVLFHALAVGIEVLNLTDAFEEREHAQCHDALVRLTSCPRCVGLSRARPCAGYCLNVLRGCLTAHASELDAPWNGYVEALEKLVNAIKQHNNEAGVNADAVLRELDNRISEAIMHAMTKGMDIDAKAKKFCGLPNYSSKEDPLGVETSTPPTGAGGAKTKFTPTRAPAFLPPPEQHFVYFLTSISKTKGFYGGLADSICRDESFAEPNDRRCWNGERIAEYTKTVVDASIDMQKYNPEVKPNVNLQNGDKRIADLADKLRHIHTVVMNVLGSTYSNEFDSMQRDSGADGSGSGNGPDIEDEDDEYTRGSGSGDGPSVIEETSRTNEPTHLKPSVKIHGDKEPKTRTHQTTIQDIKPTKDTSSSRSVHYSSSLLIYVTLLFTILPCFTRVN